MSASSLVFSSKLTLSPMVSSTTNSHVLNVVTHVKNKKKLSCHPTSSQHITFYKKTSTDVIYPNVSVLPGLLLKDVLAMHGVVDHQTTLAEIRQVGYQIKEISMNFIVLQFSCLWVRWGRKEPNLQNPPLATFYHFGASWKAVITRPLTFEQRQIEGQSWWQNWPILCAL